MVVHTEIEPKISASRFSLRRGPRSFGPQDHHLIFCPHFWPKFWTRSLTTIVESGALKPLVDARDFELTTDGVGDIVKASMTHRTKGKLVLTVSKQ